MATQETSFTIHESFFQIGAPLRTLRGVTDKISLWLFSLLVTLGVPCIPIAADYFRGNGEVRNETFLITALILSAVFLVSAEHFLYRSFYIFLLGITILLDLVTGPNASTMADRWSGILLAIIVLLHASERFYWHVIQERPFPAAAKKVV